MTSVGGERAWEFGTRHSKDGNRPPEIADVDVMAEAMKIR